MLGLGYSTRRAALVLYAVCGLSASLAILASVLPGGLRWPVLVVFCGLVLFGIKRLGYVEFAAARQTLSGTTILRAVKEEIFLREFQQALLQAESLDAWWKVICGACTELEFSSAHLSSHGRNFHAQFAQDPELSSCEIYLDAGYGEHIILKRCTRSSMPRVAMAVVHHLQASLDHRSASLDMSMRRRATTAA